MKTAATPRTTSPRTRRTGASLAVTLASLLSAAAVDAQISHWQTDAGGFTLHCRTSVDQTSGDGTWKQITVTFYAGVEPQAAMAYGCRDSERSHWAGLFSKYEFDAT